LRSIQIFQRSGDDGNLTLRIPVGEPDVEYDVLVMLRPKKPNVKAADWPPGFVDNTYGSINDDTFFRHPQGELPKPIEFD
jgi:hypothetical protein